MSDTYRSTTTLSSRRRLGAAAARHRRRDSCRHLRHQILNRAQRPPAGFCCWRTPDQAGAFADAVRSGHAPASRPRHAGSIAPPTATSGSTSGSSALMRPALDRPHLPRRRRLSRCRCRARDQLLSGQRRGCRRLSDRRQRLRVDPPSRSASRADAIIAPPRIERRTDAPPEQRSGRRNRPAGQGPERGKNRRPAEGDEKKATRAPAPDRGGRRPTRPRDGERVLIGVRRHRWMLWRAAATRRGCARSGRRASPERRLGADFGDAPGVVGQADRSDRGRRSSDRHP